MIEKLVEVLAGERDAGLRRSFATFLGRGSEAKLVVVAAAYRVEGSGAQEAAPMVLKFLDRIGEEPALRTRYLEWPR